MNVMCNDNRFELIAKYKAELIESTNIGTSADEMAVIDNILFRMWQMGWLDRFEQPTVDAVPVVRCGECKYYLPWDDATYGNCKVGSGARMKDWYCNLGERKDGEHD